MANSGVTELPTIIHQNAQQWYQEAYQQMPSTEPAADTSLGLVYNPSATDPEFQLQDTDSLNEAFFAVNDIALPFAGGGMHIGDFDPSGDFGIIVIFEKIGFQPTFKLARELDSLLEFTALGASPTNAEIFQRKHKKEDVLAFIDAAAFFGAFFNSGLNVYEVGSFSEKSGDALYNDVTSKFLNKNKLYIDIRNEYDDSFNYYENYNDIIQWNLDNSTVLTDINYSVTNGLFW